MSTLSTAADPWLTRIDPGASTPAPHLSTIIGMDTRTRWQIDPDASRVTFTIRKRLFFLRHLTVTGQFSAVQGTIELDDQQPTTARASVSFDVAGIDTRQARRDAYLGTVRLTDRCSRMC